MSEILVEFIDTFPHLSLFRLLYKMWNFFFLCPICICLYTCQFLSCLLVPFDYSFVYAHGNSCQSPFPPYHSDSCHTNTMLTTTAVLALWPCLNLPIPPSHIEFGQIYAQADLRQPRSAVQGSATDSWQTVRSGIEACPWEVEKSIA